MRVMHGPKSSDFTAHAPDLRMLSPTIVESSNEMRKAQNRLSPKDHSTYYTQVGIRF